MGKILTFLGDMVLASICVLIIVVILVIVIEVIHAVIESFKK